MIREERLARLMDHIKIRHFVSVDELIKLLGVSKATVRRDLLQLHKEGRVFLTRGGAALSQSDRSNSSHEPTYVEKKDTNITEKQRIGEAAIKMIHTGDTIFISAGTTTRSLVPFLNTAQNINLVTNDLLIAADATSYDGVNITVTGGQVRKNHYTLRGAAAEDYIGKMSIHTAFLGMDAIDVSLGCFIANADEVSLIRRVIESSSKVVILCDHSKFSNKAFMLVCPLDDIDVIITDDIPDEAIKDILDQKNIKVIII